MARLTDEQILLATLEFTTITDSLNKKHFSIPENTHKSMCLVILTSTKVIIAIVTEHFLCAKHWNQYVTCYNL